MDWRTTTAALAPIVLVGALASAIPTSAAGAADTCQGQAATITADATGRYQGTDGPDVIVVSERGVVAGEGGDDLICISSAAGTLAASGPGDDTVVVTDRTTYGILRVELGEGDDRFQGGPGRDHVGQIDGDSVFYEQGYDVIDTGAGRDRVQAGSDARRTHHLEVDLGAGEDHLEVFGGGVTAQSRLEGGAGRDLLSMNSDEEGTDVALDLQAHTIDRDGRIVGGWSSFERHYVKEFGATVTVQGSSGRDEVEVGVAQRYDIALGDGPDSLILFKPENGTASGGRGRDHIEETANRHIDLAAGTVGRLAIRSFEDATSLSGTVTGNARANDIVVGCGTVRGGAGADRLREFTPPRLRFPHPDACDNFLALGGPGKDVLTGSRGPDRLIGGPGTDTAIGRGGGDVCQVERRRTCGR